MNAQDAIEATQQQAGTSAFTFALQYYGPALGYLVLMINETYDNCILPAAPFFYMIKPDSEKVGTCKLCHREGELCESHIISEFLYASMYDEKHRFRVVAPGEVHSSFGQKGYRERLLCQPCETKLSKWETYARGLLIGGTQLRYRREGTITWVEGIDYSRFKLFQLSILWRAGVATLEFFRKVTLGPHAERLRAMLLAEDPGEPWEYGCVTIGIHHRGTMVPVIVQPTPLRIMDAKGVRFTFGGYLWAYRIASHRPVQPGFTEAVLQRSGCLAVKFEPLETAGFYKDFLRNHGSNARTP